MNHTPVSMNMHTHSRLSRLIAPGAAALGVAALLSSTALVGAPSQGAKAEDSFLKSPICHGWSYATAKTIQVAQTEVSPKPQSAPIVPTLEKVLARDPRHPGASHYYIHAVEASDRPERAEPYADGLRGAMPAAGHLIPDEPAKSIAMLQPVKAAPYFAHAQFSPPDTVLALPDPGDQIPLVKAMWHYARGIAFAAKRDAEQQGKYQDAVKYFDKAAELQDGLPYMEPPYWYYPVRQSLGAALLKAGRLDEAEEQFEASLRRAPANGWSYYGLMEVYKAKGDAQAASDAEAAIARSWTGDRKLLQLSNL